MPGTRLLASVAGTLLLVACGAASVWGQAPPVGGACPGWICKANRPCSSGGCRTAWLGPGPAPIAPAPKPGEYGGTCVNCMGGFAKYCIRGVGNCPNAGAPAACGMAASAGTCSPVTGTCLLPAAAPPAVCNLVAC